LVEFRNELQPAFVVITSGESVFVSKYLMPVAPSATGMKRWLRAGNGHDFVRIKCFLA
jgi:hypothetical protein